MALPPITKNTFYKPDNTKKNYNGIAFSIAWLCDGKWKTYYRKFNLRFRRKNLLVGSYAQNLYFDEKINLENESCQFMIYGVPFDMEYTTVQESFKNNKFDIFLFKEIFILDKKKWDLYSPNLKFFNDTKISLTGKSHYNNQLQIKAYIKPLPKGLLRQKKPFPKRFNSKLLVKPFPKRFITFPLMQIPIKNITIKG